MTLAREDLSALKPGDVVCVVGYGTANLVHRHHRVVSVTKQFVNSNWSDKRGVYPSRHRVDNGRSTPYGEYGGTTLHLTCRRAHQEES